MAIIMERRLLLYTAGGAALAAAPSLSEKLMIRYHKTPGGHVKMECPPAAPPPHSSLFTISSHDPAAEPQRREAGR